MTRLLIFVEIGLLIYSVFAAYWYGYAMGMKAEREAQRRRGRFRPVG